MSRPRRQSAKATDDSAERRLVEAARADAARFGELYELHFDCVYGYISRRVMNRADAEDVTADVFRKALAGIGRFEWRGVPFAAWLLRIAANALADRGQRLQRHREISISEDPPEVSTQGLREAQERAQVFKLVGGLPEDQRRVVVLRFVEGKSIREIAEELGRSEGAVKQLQFRALRALRARMGGKHA
jgi:RNA polymerase sigma-70 factor (ECF subfamily)